MHLLFLDEAPAHHLIDERSTRSGVGRGTAFEINIGPVGLNRRDRQNPNDSIWKRPRSAGHCLVVSMICNAHPRPCAALQLRKEGFLVRDEDVARLSPLIHDHINMLGRYSFAIPETVARGELRPLRNPGDPDA